MYPSGTDTQDHRGPHLPRKEVSIPHRLWTHAIPSVHARLALLPEHAFPAGTSWRDFKTAKFSVATLMSNLQSEAESADPDSDALKIFQQATTQATAPDQERNRLIEAGKRHVSEGMRTGAIRAFGFEQPRRLDDAAVELDAAMIAGNPYFRWDNGTAKYQGLSFAEIRMMDSTRATALVAKWRAEDRTGARILTDTSPNPVGRPSWTPEIERAFEALKSAGKINFQAKMASHYPTIRQWLAVHSSSLEANDSTPGDEAIRRVISPHFKAAKASKL